MDSMVMKKGPHAPRERPLHQCWTRGCAGRQAGPP
jgi:hypothetical protein